MADGVLASVLPWLPPAVVVAGWWVTNRQNDNRERRKEIRADLSGFSKNARELVDLSVEYQTTPRSIPQEAKILREISHLSYRLGRLRKNLNGSERPGIQAAWFEFKEHLTDRNFRTDHHVALDHHDPSLGAIWASAEHLIDELEEAFSALFP